MEYIRLGREEEQIEFGREIPNVMLLHPTPFTALMLSLSRVCCATQRQTQHANCPGAGRDVRSHRKVCACAAWNA
jgi:hypothetical protein